MSEEVDKVEKDGYFKIPVGSKITTPSGDILYFSESDWYTSILTIDGVQGGGEAHYWLGDVYDGNCIK